MVRRKQSGNAVDYFDKTFAEYQEGFSANGDNQREREKIWNSFFQERAGLA